MQTETDNPRPQMLTVQEAADLLGKSRPTVYRWLQRRLLPGRQIGKTWVIPRHQLLMFLEGRRLRGWDRE